MRQPKNFQVGGIAGNYMRSGPSIMPLKRPSSNQYTVTSPSFNPYDSALSSREMGQSAFRSGTSSAAPQQGMLGSQLRPQVPTQTFQSVSDQMGNRQSINANNLALNQAMQKRQQDFQAGIFPLAQMEADYFGVPLEQLQQFRAQQQQMGMPTGQSVAGMPGQLAGVGLGGLPQGIDPRAVAADPEGFARNLEGARQQEATMPGSTFLGQQFAGNGPSIGNTFAGAKSAFGPGTNPPAQMKNFTTGFSIPQGLSPVNPMAPPQTNPMTLPQRGSFNLDVLNTDQRGGGVAQPAPLAAQPNPLANVMTQEIKGTSSRTGPKTPEQMQAAIQALTAGAVETPYDVSQLRQENQEVTAQPSQLPPPTVAAGETPYVSGVNQTTVTSDPTTQQLLFGLDGQGGFIPGAMQAAENTFFNPDGTPRVVDQEIAGLTPDQERAMELARGQVGIQDRFLGGAEDLYQEGVRRSDQGLERQRELGRQALGSIQRGVSEEEALRDRGLEGLLSSIGQGRQLAGGATSDLYGRLGETENIQRGAVDQFGRQLGGIESIRRGAAEDFGGRLGESEDLIRGTTGAYDQDLTKQFYDPYEDRVVSQTVEDALKGADKADMAQFARDVASGGESAFGSRARLTAGERRESLGRGLAQELAGIRSRGFTEAQRAGTSEFARQKAAETAAGSNLAGLSGQRLGAQQQLASGLGSLSGQQLAAQEGLASGLGAAGQQRYGAGTNLGSTLVGLGQTAGQAFSGAGQAALGSAGQLASAQGDMGGIQGQIGQQQLQSRAGLGSFMQGLGSQAQQAGMTGINALASSGSQQQQLMQQMLDAQRQNAMTAQQAPLAQYQSLLPFIQAVPQGQQQTQTAYTPRPSALQAGLATGLGAFGAIGNYMNPYGQRQVGVR